VDLLQTDGGGPTCTGGGAPITVQSDAGTWCTGTIAQVTFRFGICACSDVKVTSGDLFTDAFDSTGRADAGLGASVGANGRFLADSFFDIGGSVWAGSASGAQNDSNSSRVRQDFWSHGPVSGGGSLAVSGDAHLNGDVQTQLSVGGKLYIPAGANVGGAVNAAGGVVRGPVAMGPPCDCSASQLIDIAGIVADGQAHNDNALLGLDSRVFENLPGPRRLDLPCGRYYLSRITPGFPGTIAVHGRTAIFIGGNLDTSRANFDVAIDPQGELDIFIGGTIINSTGMSLGNIESPAQLRVYVAGSPVDMSAPSKTAGNYYLPNSVFSSPSNLDLYGAIFAKSFEGQGAVHYDRGVLSAGSSCGGPPGGGCSSCRDCGNQACVGGKCGACTTSSECCAPLVCLGGLCQSQIN
jgi:hypothetical protein